MRRWISPLIAALGLLALRAPIWRLPGLGRDEATYLYWSEHVEVAYAPILQGVLWLLRHLGGSAPWILRLPSILGALLVLWLFDRWLDRRGCSPESRAVAIAAVALSPWQTLVGSLIHPDNLMVAALLAFALLADRDRILSASLAAIAALWAKPSGALAVVVAALWLVPALHDRHRRRAQVGLALLATAGVVTWAQWDRGMIEGLLSFGRLDPSISPLARLALGLGTLVFVSGPIPMVCGIRGIARSTPRAPGQLLGLAYLVAFGLAAIALGQVKANWMVPGFLLLWSPEPLPRRVAWPLALAPAVASVAMVVAFHSPAQLRALEERVGPHLPSYLAVAGVREAEMSSTRQWWHRMSEYQSLEARTRELLRRFPELRETATIVSDDYGLAAQMAWQLHQLGPIPLPRLVVPVDPLFEREVVDGSQAVLVLALRHDVEELYPNAVLLTDWPHPISTEAIHIALAHPKPRGTRR